MNHRVAPVFAVASALLFPSVADAQGANQEQQQGQARPPSPQGDVFAQPTDAKTYSRPGSAAATHPSASPPTPAAYQDARYPAYGNQYPVDGSQFPAYAGQSPATNRPLGNGGPAGWSAAPGAEAPAPLVQTKDNLHNVEMGMGAFVPTDQGNTAKLALEASLWALHGGWVPSSGLYMTLDAATGFDIGCLAKVATDGCKVHLRIHWLGAGPFFNTATPMIASDVSRSWDLMALTGAEVRLWKGMTVKATVNWFLPSPWGVYAHEKELAEAKANGTAAIAAKTTADGAASAQAEAQPSPMDAVQSTFVHVLKHPQLNMMAMWEF